MLERNVLVHFQNLHLDKIKQKKIWEHMFLPNHHFISYGKGAGHAVISVNLKKQIFIMIKISGKNYVRSWR
jgi:hypothetical protein